VAQKDSSPATWSDALSNASQAIAAGLSAPDADVKFGLAMLGAMATHRQRQAGPGPGGAAGPGGPAGGGMAGSPPAGMPGSPGGGPPGPPSSPGSPPGLSPAAGPAGGGAPNSAMPSNAAPGGPIPGGMSPGLSPNPDELRRVLSDVAGQ
jgi:hypothetical protein